VKTEVPKEYPDAMSVWWQRILQIQLGDGLQPCTMTNLQIIWAQHYN